jgi:hypothetical protein
MEIWKLIPSYENYSISNYGRVVNNKSSRVLVPIVTKKGYLTVRLYNDDGYKQLRIHRLVASEFLENVYNKPQVNHIDFDKSNNWYNNLEWVDNSENVKHNVSNNRHNPALGIKSHFSKLKDDDIINIRILSKNMNNVEISKIYNITPGNVGNIVNKKTWKHI